MGVTPAVAGLGITGDPLVAVDGSVTPGQLAQQLIHHGIVFYSLHGHPDPLHARGEGRPQGSVVAFGHAVETAEETHVAAKVEQHAVDPIMTIETLGPVPA